VKLIKSFYLSHLFFLFITVVIFLFIISYLFPQLLIISKLFLLSVVVFTIFDVLILYANRQGIYAYRESPNRLSNGDENEIKIFITNNYSYRIKVIVIDELPFEFQIRDNSFSSVLKSGITKVISYFLRPVKRGEYNFGNINVYVSSRIGFVRRRYRLFRFILLTCR